MLGPVAMLLYEGEAHVSFRSVAMPERGGEDENRAPRLAVGGFTRPSEPIDVVQAIVVAPENRQPPVPIVGQDRVLRARMLVELPNGAESLGRCRNGTDRPPQC